MGLDPPSSELLSGNVFELFDPLKQSNRPYSWPSKLNEAGTNTPPFVTPNNETPPLSVSIPSVSPSTSSSYPYPIKLRLKLTTFPDIKPFSHLVQQIRNENQVKQVQIILFHHIILLDILSANTSSLSVYKHLKSISSAKKKYPVLSFS
jgi:hypothetical protein